MPESIQFSEVLHEWAHVFMRRSMHDFIKFTKDNGLSNMQVGALMWLYHRGTCGVSDMGSHIGVTSAAASQMIERLVQQDLVERQEDPHDRRAKQLSLTPTGRALIEQGIEARRRWMEELTTTLTPAQQAEIIAALTYLTDAARKLEPPEA